MEGVIHFTFKEIAELSVYLCFYIYIFVSSKYLKPERRYKPAQNWHHSGLCHKGSRFFHQRLNNRLEGGTGKVLTSENRNISLSFFIWMFYHETTDNSLVVEIPVEKNRKHYEDSRHTWHKKTSVSKNQPLKIVFLEFYTCSCGIFFSSRKTYI